MSGKIKIVLLLAGLAVLSFGASFAASTWMAKRTGAAQTAKDHQSTSAPSASTLPAEIANAAVSLQPKEKQLDDLVRELHDKLDECQKRQQELDRRERRLQIAQETLKKQAEDLENLRVALVSPLANLKKAQEDLLSTRTLVSAQEATNLKRTAAVYEKLPPESGGKMLEAMCANKQEDDAAKILYYMTERGAAKLIDGISDKALASRLSMKMKTIKQES